MDNSPSQKPETIITEIARILKKEYVVVGKRRVRFWHSWLVMGLLMGFTAGVLFVANNSGEIEPIEAATVVPADTVVAHWKFDEGSGTTASDSSGNGNNGTLVNGPVWTAGKFSGALNFDGVNDKVQVTTSGGINGMTDMTISLWFKQESAGGGGFGRLVRKGNTTSPTRANVRWEIFASNAAVSFNAGYSTSTGIWTVPLPALNNWHHIAVVYTHGNTTNDPIIYVDGSSVAITESITPSGAIMADDGALTLGDWGDGTRVFDGTLDDVQISNTRLTASDVVDIFSAGGGIVTPPPPSSKPNIVVIMTDDQDDSGSMDFLPKTKSLLASNGMTFSNSFVDFPLCCPSRATFLTGQDARNHGVLGNADESSGGYAKLLPTVNNTLPVWLQNAGYNTALVGKYLNGYGDGILIPKTNIPPGWNKWVGLTENSNYITYYNYTLNDNGSLHTYSSTAADYQTDVLAQKATDYIGSRSGSSQPFFLWLTPFAPHADKTDTSAINSPIPAPRHAGTLSSVPLPTPPNFNEADVSDKPAYVKAWPFMTSTGISNTAGAYRKALETTLAVDDMVEKVVNALQAAGKLDNTIIVFTSDNGYFRGEHRKPNGKYWLYEPSIRVPLVIRGPGISANTVKNQLVTNVDLVSTILDYAVAAPGRTQDGKSLKPILSGSTPSWRNGFFFQGIDTVKGSSCGEACPRFNAIRTSRYVYAEHATGEKELYDLAVDPYQLASKHNDPAYSSVKNFLASKLATLKTCVGSGCWYTDTDPLPGTTDTILPTVSITAPTSGATVSGASVTINATAYDNIGVAGVQFKLDGTNLGAEDTTSPYSISWNTTSAPNGSHVLTAVARDAAGNQGTSGSVSVTVNNIGVVAPTVTLSASPTTITSGGSATLTWSSTNATSCTASGAWTGAKALSGSQTTGAMTIDQTFILTCTGAGGSIAQSTTITVTTVLTSIKFNINDRVQTTATLNVRSTPSISGILLGAQPPSVLGTVIGGSTYAGGYHWWQINYDNAPDGWSVEDFLNKVLPIPTLTLSASPLSVTSGSPSTLTWSSTNTTSCTASGAWSGSKTTSGTQIVNPTVTSTYTLTCTGTGGSVIKFVTVTVSATTDIISPTVSITSPTSGATVSGSSVPVNANASDNVGVAGVQFKLDGANLGAEDTTSPYGITWNTTSVPNGPHSLTAVARDVAGNQGISGSVSVTVNNIGVIAPTVTLSASPTAITSGGSATLAWSSTNATSCTASGAWSGSKTTSGTQVVNPTVTSTYTLTCTGTGGSITQSTTVTVTAVLTSIKFNIGDRVQTTATLNVRSTPSTSGILLGTQTMGALGTVIGGPTYAGGYHWWQINYDNAPDGWSVENFLNKVLPIPTLTLSASPTSVTSGSPSTLTWSSTNTTSCTASGAWFGSKTTLGTQIVNPIVTSIYTLTCTGSGGSVIKFVTVTVSATADIISPSVPAGLTATAVSSSQINLAWSAATDAVGVAGYKIFRGGTQIATVSETTYSNTGLSPLTSYSYSVSAYDAAGNTSAQSTAKSATTLALTSPDTTLPTVSITAPLSGATVFGSAVTVSATASDNIGVAGVQFKLDGTNLGVEDTTSPYSISWNTTSVSNGSHSLTAVARDAAGNNTIASGIIVIVANAAPDTSAPTVSVTAPSSGATVFGSSVSVSASAADNIGVAGVQFKLDNEYLGPELALSSFSYAFNSTAVANGSHSILAVARDAAGNRATSSAVTFTVSNAITIPVLTIANVGAAAISAHAAVISATTNIPARTALSYGVVESVALNALATSTSYSNAHSWNLGGLRAGSEYRYRITAQSDSGLLAMSDWKEFTTQRESITGAPTPPPASLLPGAPISLFVFRDFLFYGQRGSNVFELQQFLILRGELSAGNNTGFFGPLTRSAVIIFQTRNGIPGTGFVGPLTIQKLNQLRGGGLIQSSSVTFTKPLFIGVRDPQVFLLQQVLTKEGFLASVHNTGYYGPITLGAVKQFQCRYNIVCNGDPLSTGWGLVGGKTRQQLNILK